MKTQHESIIISVSPGINKTWDVMESPARKPLASFANPQDACAWAIEMARAKDARVVVEQIKSRAGIASGAKSASPDFPIPVMLDNDSDGRFRPPRRAAIR